MFGSMFTSLWFACNIQSLFQYALIPKFMLMFASLWFACNIQSRVVEG